MNNNLTNKLSDEALHPVLRVGAVGRSISSRYTVRSIDNIMVVEWLKKIHYAKRLPIMKTVFGVFDEELMLCGVCVFSPAPSRFWNNGGKLFNDKHNIEVIELSRLCLYENHEKNLTSYFVSQCLKQLPKPNVVVSYADKNQNHTGYIYQACNFIYCGEAEPKNKSMDFILFGKKYHGRNMNIEFTRKMLGKKYNEDLHWKDNILAVGGEIIKQEPKHRYIFINAKNKKQLIQDMIYKSQPYPKQPNKNYEVIHNVSIQRVLF
jgi:hypothetical protein